MNALTRFLERGPERRRALNNALSEGMDYYLGPTGIPQRLNALGILNPINDMEQAGRNAQDMLAPGRTGQERFNSGVGMVTDMATVLAPVAAGKFAGSADDAANFVESLTGIGAMERQGAMDAGRRFVDDEAGEVGVNKLTQGQMNYLERINASTPSAWNDPKYAKPQWHPASKTSMSIPADEVVPKWDRAVDLGQDVPMDIADLQGRIITPAYGDRTRAGGNLVGYNDIDFQDPVRMLGGRDFMREPNTGLWASEKGPMSAKNRLVSRLVEEGEDPALVYTAMNSQSGDFSTLMMEATMNQYAPEKISDVAARTFDDRMAKLGVKGWPGSKADKSVIQDALSNMPGSMRWQVWQEMDKAAYKSGGFPDIGQTRVAITDPDLLNATPFDSGLSVGRPSPGLISEGYDPHPSYSHQIGGEYEGTMGNLPGQIIWRDFFEKRRSGGASSASDQRAFMMSSPNITQRVDQQMVDEVSDYLQQSKSR